MDIAAAALVSPNAPTSASANAAAARIDKAAEEFEALVLAQFLAPLFSSVETPGIAGGGPGDKAFAGLLQEEYAKAIAARGGFGIADQVKASLIALQSNRAETSFR